MLARDDNRYRLFIAGLILWAQFAHGMNVVALAPVLPLISEEYDISHTSGGLLLGVVMLIQGVFGLVTPAACSTRAWRSWSTPSSPATPSPPSRTATTSLPRATT